MHLEYIARSCLYRWAGHASVEAPRFGRAAGLELPVDLARLEIQRHYFPTGIGRGALVRSSVRLAPIVGYSVSDRAVSVMAVSVLAVPVPRVLMLTMFVSGGLVMRVRHDYL
jgi:hypothetical protein